MYKQYGAAVISILFAVMMILFPTLSMEAVTDAMKLWALTVVPSLLPFLICSNFMYKAGFTYRFSQACEPAVRRIFNTSGACAFPFVMSMMSGYPVGVKLLSDARTEGLIEKRDAEKGISFCSTSGPMFMIGAVGAGMIGNEIMGWSIALSHWIGAVINGMLYGRLLKSERSDRDKLSLGHNKISAPSQNYNAVLGASITDSMNTMLLIGGYMAVFMMMIYFTQSHINELPPWFNGLIELSVGCRDTAEYVYYTEMYKTVLCTAMISFGGLCVIFQSMSFISRSDISIRIFIMSKISHCMISTAAAVIICRIAHWLIPTDTDVFSFCAERMTAGTGRNEFLYNLLFSGGMICFLVLLFVLVVTFYGIGVNIIKVLKRNKDIV